MDDTRIMQLFSNYLRDSATIQRNQGVIKARKLLKMIGIITFVVCFHNALCKYKPEWIRKEGTLELEDGGTYNGQYLQHIKNHAIIRQGHGILDLPNGDKLECDWRGDKPNGQGIMTSAEGNVLKAEWRDGDVQGFGTTFVYNLKGLITCPDRLRRYVRRGDIHQSIYVDGKSAGFGFHLHDDGTVRYVWWEDGNLMKELYVKKWGEMMTVPNHSDGFMIPFINGTGVYKGQVVSVEGGKVRADGIGWAIFKDGRMIHSEWKDGVPHGKSVIIQSDGYVVDGEFQHNILTNSSIYAGNWCEEQKGELMKFDWRMRLDSMIP